MTVDAKTQVLTKQELQEALEGLTVADRVRLQRKAQYYAGNTGSEWRDLLHEAICRSLEENGRRCPREVNVVVFLGNVMRSIADTERKKSAREVVVDIASSDFMHPTTDASGILNPEEELLGTISHQQTVEKIESLFLNDPQALAIIMGDMEDLSPTEIRELEPMTELEYATARKRVRRALIREFPEGMKQ